MSKCDVVNKLELAHRFVHECMEDMDDKELDQVEELGQRILELLNDERQYNNNVKLLAIFEVLGIGVEVMQGRTLHKDWENGTVTVQ